MKILDFPILRQTFDYDCGAKALQSVLVYYGVEVREDTIIKLAHTNKDIGTPIEGIIETIEKYGLKYVSKSMNISEVKDFIDKNVPVIVVIQAWKDKKNVDWKNDWDDGHYVTIIGYDSEKIIFEDPSSFEKTYLTCDEFLKRWHDVDSKGKKYFNHGIAVFGKEHKFDSEKLIHMG